MKHIIALFCLALVFTACEGDQGPPGVDGVDGDVGVAFEIELNFNEANNFEHFEDYGFNIVPSDVILTYISWETDNGQEIWRLLPQTTFFEDGAILTYNYDFTETDVRIFLDGNGSFDLVNLGPDWTDNQLFRVVVVPADYISAVDTSNLDAVIEAANITEFNTTM